jgi:hypothetical protein
MLLASTAAGSGGAYSLSTLNPHDACGTIRFVGNYQPQAGRPSGSGAKVRHGMRGQRDARLNLDLHAMTEAPESQMHLVDRVRCVLPHAINHNAVAQKKRAPTVPDWHGLAAKLRGNRLPLSSCLGRWGRMGTDLRVYPHWPGPRPSVVGTAAAGDLLCAQPPA